MEFKVENITDNLLNIYKKYAEENYYLGYYRKYVVFLLLVCDIL